MADAGTLYHEDFVAWSKQQAEALRVAARTGSNLPVDWENLAEEVETLGASGGPGPWRLAAAGFHTVI